HRNLHSFPTRRSSDLRLIRIAPRGVVAAGGEEVELVAVVAVPAAGRDQYHTDGHGQPERRPPGQPPDGSRGSRPGRREGVHGARSEEHTSELQSLAYL